MHVGRGFDSSRPAERVGTPVLASAAPRMGVAWPVALVVERIFAWLNQLRRWRVRTTSGR